MSFDARNEDTFHDPNALAPAREDGLVLLSNASMRARRRPVAIALLWTTQAMLALGIAWPVAQAVSVMYGASPRGDAMLWEPGAYVLADFAVRSRGAELAIAAMASFIFLAGAFIELVPLGALIASLAFVTRDRRAPPLRSAIARGLDAFPTLVVLLVGATAMEVTLVFCALLLESAVEGEVIASLGEARAEQLGWLAALAVLLLAAVVGVAHDLARTAAVRFRVRAIRSAQLAINTLRRGPVSLTWSWAWRALAAWFPVAVGGLVAAQIGGRAGFALVALAIVHQLALVARVALRASWLAQGLRAVDRAHRVMRRVSQPTSDL